MKLALFSTLILTVSSVTGIAKLAFAHALHDQHHAPHVAHDQTATATRASLALARQQLADYQRTASHASLGLARETVETLLHRRPQDAEALTLLAYVQQGEHQFERARGTLRRVLALAPQNDEARLLLATVSLVSGDVTEARAACRALRSTTPAVSIGCFAAAALADEDAATAYPKVARLLTADALSLPTTTAAWLQSLAGDLAMALDQPDTAARHYAESLARVERAQVRAALFDALLANGNREAARATATTGPSLALQVRALIVADEVGRAHRISHAHAQFCEWIDQEDWTHAREMARFYLDVLPRPQLARALARINLQRQREPEDLRLAQRSAAVHTDAAAAVGCAS